MLWPSIYSSGYLYNFHSYLLFWAFIFQYTFFFGSAFSALSQGNCSVWWLHDVAGVETNGVEYTGSVDVSRQHGGGYIVKVQQSNGVASQSFRSRLPRQHHHRSSSVHHRPRPCTSHVIRRHPGRRRRSRHGPGRRGSTGVLPHDFRFVEWRQRRCRVTWHCRRWRPSTAATS